MTNKLKLVQSAQPVAQLSLDADEVMIVFQGLKGVLRLATEPNVNATLDYVYKTVDLLKQLQPLAVQIAEAQQPAPEVTNEEAPSPEE